METIFKIGDTVYDSVHYPGKKGTIIDITDANGAYPLFVNFEGYDYHESYTEKGAESIGELPTLSFTPYDLVKGGFTQERPVKIPEKGQLVYVKGFMGFDEEEWHMRFFSHYKNGLFHCFEQQKKDGKTFNWNFCETENPLLK